MAWNHSAHLAFVRAVEKIGGQSATSRLIGKSQQSISARLRNGRVAWAEDVLTIEHASGVSRYELRPDLFGVAPQLAVDDGQLEGVRR